jgi:hypothetical protein
MEVRVGRMARNRFQENRTTSAAIGQQPKPEVGSLARSSECSPGAAEQRKIQENDGIGRTQADLDSIIRAEIAIHDPSLVFDKPLLYLNPPVVRRCDEAALPEDLVQFYYWKRCDLAQPRR